jgi:hypothetical protein
MVTAAAVPLIGLTALGAEAGSWYLIRRHAQNAADAAAYAGALALTLGQSAPSEGINFAAQDGFTTSSNCPPGSPTQSVCVIVTSSNGGGNDTVRAVVTQNQPTLLASLFLGSTVAIIATAVAQVQHPEQVCALALAGMTIGGSQNFTGGNCALASNTTVRFNSPPSFSGSGWAVAAAQGCLPNASNCTMPIGVSYNYSQPATTVPQALVTLEADNFFSTSGGSSPPNCSSTTCAPLNPSATSQGDLIVNNGGIQNLSCPSGSTSCTYIFNSITVRNGGSLTSCVTQPSTAAAALTCTPNAGVNIVVGSGGLNINGDLNLEANPTNGAFPELSGVLFYDTETSNNLQINGSSSSVYGGAMFFPNANVTWNGNSAASNNCTEIVAQQLSFSGNNATNLNFAGCPASVLPQTQVVLLIG